MSTIFSLLSSTLKPTPGFSYLTASQRKMDAFLLGETLTHWFALTHMNARIVVPLETYSGSLTKTGSNAPYPKAMPKYFRHAIVGGAKSEPDFLAFTATGGVHVLESKGRANFTSWGMAEKELNAARNKALRQVCKIARVNGAAPLTRTACVFGFHQFGTIGQITDPPATDRYDYRTEWPTLIKQAYAAVLDPLFEANMREIDRGYVGIEFMPGWRFGINEAVYKRVRSVRDDASASDLLQFLGRLKADGDRASKAEDRSVGADGLILIGDPDALPKTWRERLA